MRDRCNLVTDLFRELEPLAFSNLTSFQLNGGGITHASYCNFRETFLHNAGMMQRARSQY